MSRARRDFLALVVAGAAATGLPAFAQVEDDTPPNVFIAPSGEPFRAAELAPYPVAAWFAQADKNGDGKLDHAEFLDDALAFFRKLDRRSANALDGLDIQVYEYEIAPEVIGRAYQSARLLRPPSRARLWLAQAGGGPPPDQTPDTSNDLPPPQQKLDESGAGASPYSFFEEPEPVTAADFGFTGVITRANFVKLADMHFTALDKAGLGYLTLATLPKTPVQRQLEKRPHRHA